MDMPSLEYFLERDQLWLLVPLGNKRYFAPRFHHKILELDWGQKFLMDPHQLEVTMIPAQHWSARGLWDRNEALWGGAAFRFKDAEGSILFAGDTGFNPMLNDWIKEHVSKIELSFIPIGAFAPEWFMHSHHLSPSDAIKMANAIGSKQNVAMHFGTFPMADDGPWEAVDKLELIKKENPIVNFKIPKLGEQWSHFLSIRAITPAY
jgi:L-ascorbate metabolism protein UlaG (beta-lactamase superfamily)